MRYVVGGRATQVGKEAASTSVVGRFETYGAQEGSAYNLSNFLRRLALPREVKHWSPATLREKLVKTGAKVTRRSRYITFQLAEVAVSQRLFAAILDRITRLAISLLVNIV